MSKAGYHYYNHDEELNRDVNDFTIVQACKNQYIILWQKLTILV